ncbi:MAG: tetratricopeptide repeat protein [Acidobacteria bacterium]|nr:tetratricopeptide repeat protein [Acidobacteriota bacterium]
MRGLTFRIQNLLCLLAALCVGPAPGVRAAPPDPAATGVQGQKSARAVAAGDSAARLVDEGVAALERGDVAGARESFGRAVELDAKNVAAHTYLGVIADQSNDLAGAERHFAAAAIAAPLLPSARNNYGAVLLRLGRTAQAAKQFEATLKLDANQPSALVNLAQIRFGGGTPADLRDALSLFERARAVAPDPAIVRSLVVISLRLGDRASAARYYREYADALAAPAGGDAPASAAPAARAEIGAALLEAGLAEEAARELAAAAAGDPANADLVVRLARAHLARKDVRAAGVALESAVARGLDAAPVYAALAEVYEASGHAENAIPAMRLAIERDPANEDYRLRYGLLLTDTRAPKAAVIRLREALKEFPRSSRLWFALGVAHFTDRQLVDAAEAFGRAVEFDPKFAPALAYLGITLAEQGQFTEAVPFYERAVAADERLAVARYLVADAMLKQAAPDTARAEAHLARAVALDPSFVPARLSLAKLYFGANRLEEAAGHLRQVVAAQPGLAEAHYQLGRVYQRLKRTADAQAAFAAFKRLSDTQEQQAEDARRDLVRRLANVRF